MPDVRAPEIADDGTGSVRRSVVPSAAGRSLWLAAGWTGAGAAVLCMVVAIVVVALCWLPASGESGNAGSAIRAGVLVFLTALHGGLTLDGVPTAFVPLGLTVIVGVVAWRAGCGLADAAEDLGEERPGVLVRVGLAQVAAFTIVCGIAAFLAPLGTSSVPTATAMVAAAVLFAVTGGVAFVRWTALVDELVVRLRPETLDAASRAARSATVAITCYLGAGAALTAGSLVLHRGRVEALSAQIGGGWSGAPVLLLGVLAAPNAVIAASAYLAGPGFAIGGGTHVSLFSTAHGVLPSFPLLGAVPSGSGAPWPVLALATVTAVVAGTCTAALVIRAPGWPARFRQLALTAAIVAIGGFLLAWLGGGSVGDGRLSAIGASPWQYGLILGAEVALASALCLGVVALARLVRGRRRDDAAEHAADGAADTAPGSLRAVLEVVRTAVVAAQPTTPLPTDVEAVDQREDDPTESAAAHDAGTDADADTDTDTDTDTDADLDTTRLRPDELAG